MKIISKHKEYYDHLAGIYGIDEMMVYDRRSEFVMEKPTEFSTSSKDINTYVFAICGNIYVIYYYMDKFYHTPEELIELDIALDKDGKKPLNYLHKEYRSKYYADKPALVRAQTAYNSNNKIKTNVNNDLRMPVLISVGFPCSKESAYEYKSGKNERLADKTYWRLPLLSDFKFGKYLAAEEIYKEIYTFISWLKDHPEIPNNQTDKEKILTHGFDLKDSFRNTKK
jgi:hypothetical protein